MAVKSIAAPAFKRLDITLQPDRRFDERLGVLNPACARLRDGSLQLYPRMVALGNISRIGSFAVRERADRSLHCEQRGFALQPKTPYELRPGTDGYGCEDPRTTFVPVLDRFLMAYVAFGESGPAVAVAASEDGLRWERQGLLRFRNRTKQIADKDAAFFPEPVRSPSGIESIAFYHRPTLDIPVREDDDARTFIEKLPRKEREGIAIGYIPLKAVRSDLRELCNCVETHRLSLPEASWGLVKVGAGTPPVRVREGWLSVIHGVDVLEPSSDDAKQLRYCAGIIVHDAEEIARVVYRSPEPLFVPQAPGEIRGTVANVVFPTAIDPRGDRTFDIFYGMADYEIGRGRLTLQ